MRNKYEYVSCGSMLVRFAESHLHSAPSCCRFHFWLCLRSLKWPPRSPRCPMRHLQIRLRLRLAVTTTTATDHPFTLGERAHAYARSVFSPVTIIGPAFAAGIGQAEDEPPSWGGGAEAFGKRYGSAAARRVISETVIFGFAAADGEDPRYFPSQDRRAWARTRHAIVSTFVSPTSHGVTIPAFSRFVGVYGAAFISNTWYPNNRATAGDAAVRGTWGIGWQLGPSPRERICAICPEIPAVRRRVIASFLARQTWRPS